MVYTGSPILLYYCTYVSFTMDILHLLLYIFDGYLTCFFEGVLLLQYRTEYLVPAHDYVQYIVLFIQLY